VVMQSEQVGRLYQRIIRGGIPSILARGVSMLRCLSADGGLIIFSSGPFLTSLVASCSNRDFNELTDERPVSSINSLSFWTAQPNSKHGTWKPGIATALEQYTLVERNLRDLGCR
jgi:hypothetical protein